MKSPFSWHNQRPHLHIPSRGGLSFNLWIWGTHQFSLWHEVKKSYKGPPQCVFLAPSVVPPNWQRASVCLLTSQFSRSEQQWSVEPRKSYAESLFCPGTEPVARESCCHPSSCTCVVWRPAASWLSTPSLGTLLHVSVSAKWYPILI